MTDALLRDSQHKGTQREESHMEIAEMGVMQPQAEGCLGPPEAERGKNGFSVGPFRGSTVVQKP